MNPTWRIFWEDEEETPGGQEGFGVQLGGWAKPTVCCWVLLQSAGGGGGFHPLSLPRASVSLGRGRRVLWDTWVCPRKKKKKKKQNIFNLSFSLLIRCFFGPFLARSKKAGMGFAVSQPGMRMGLGWGGRVGVFFHFRGVFS